MPMGMHSIFPVARHIEQFNATIRTLLPPTATLLEADNTADLLPVAKACGIPVPVSFDLAGYGSPEQLARDVRFPAIVKAGVEIGLPPAQRYDIVTDPPSLVRAVARLQQFTPFPVIQELLTGDGIGYEALYDREHRAVAEFCHRRLREYPPTGGPSTYCESTHHAEAREYGRRLLDALHWTGLAMVEFKLDGEGKPFLMEINPRPWGSMELAIRSGVEFPWLAFRVARGEAFTPVTHYQDGIRLRFLMNDVQAVASLLRGHTPWKRKLAAVASLFDPRVHEGILSWSDPRPSLAYMAKGFRRATAA